MSMTRRQFTAAAVLAAAMPTLRAQPSRPLIRILVGLPPGGGTDAIARYIAEQLHRELGQPVVVENRVGIGGRLAANALKEAAPDGTTYMIAPNATTTLQKLVFGDAVSWDVLTDFAPVAGLVSYPLGMAVNPQVTGAADVAQFLDWARHHPEQASFGTPGLGGQNHFLGVQFAKVAGVALPVTPYKGTPPMITDLVGGHIPAAITLMDQMVAFHREGRLRVIGIFSAERSPLVPDIPTFTEQGYAVRGGDGWSAMWAPAGTPEAELERVRTALRKILARPETAQTLQTRLVVTPDFRDGAQLHERQRAEIEVWAPLIKDSGFKPE